MRRMVVLLAIVVSACGGKNTGTTPSPASALTGSWAGQANAPGSPAGTASVAATIAQSGATLSGTWLTNYANPIYNGSGTLAGSVTGASLSLTLNPSVPTACPYNVTATTNGSSTIDGTYATVNCTVALGGTFTLRKVS